MASTNFTVSEDYGQAPVYADVANPQPATAAALEQYRADNGISATDPQYLKAVSQLATIQGNAPTDSPDLPSQDNSFWGKDGPLAFAISGTKQLYSNAADRFGQALPANPLAGLGDIGSWLKWIVIGGVGFVVWNLASKTK